jgi:hypothetical protein
MKKSLCQMAAVLLVQFACRTAAVAQEAVSDPNESETVLRQEDREPDKDPERAAARFAEARSLYKNGLIDAACTTFEESRALATTVGVLLNLALCHRELGHLATAHDYYRRAEVLATLEGDNRRREIAHSEAATIAPLRASLELHLPEGDESQWEVRIDGVLQSAELARESRFVDAGDHLVSIQAADRVPFRELIHVRDSSRHVVVVPDLRQPLMAAASSSEPARRLSAPAPAPALIPRQTPDAGLGPQRWAALATGGAGVAALGTGLVFGVLARNDANASAAVCTVADVCRPAGVALRDRAHSHATRATVLSALGSAALVGGVSLWLLAPNRDTSPSASVRVALAASSVTAAFGGNY